MHTCVFISHLKCDENMTTEQKHIPPEDRCRVKILLLSRHLERVTVGHSCLKSFLQRSANKHNLKLFFCTLPFSFCDCTSKNINIVKVSRTMLVYFRQTVSMQKIKFF